MQAGVEARDSSRMEKNFSPLRVLVVDDEPLIRWSVAETLTGIGHEVMEASDGRSAVAALRDYRVPVDVVVLDLRLPDSDDLSLLTRIRGLWPATQVILMTAYGSPEITRGALEVGAYQVLHKPFELRDLADLVARASSSRPQ